MSPAERAGKSVGSALVVGGGIGGMQAALDLAACGIKVYVVEEKPAVGGVMSQLDKTFPTNDCAMCTQAPRLVEIGKHPDIELLPMSRVESVEGEPGRFRVRLTRRARYVDVHRCNGCGECFPGCPVVAKNDFDRGLSERRAIYKLFPQAVPNAAAIDKGADRPCRAACMDRCPVHTNVLGYVKLIAQGRFQEAYQLSRHVNPLPSVCGRVCFAPCEGACNRGQLDAPIAIRELKRFVADQVDPGELPAPRIPKTGRRVAVVGAGPAGLAAANDLALEGHEVTVFEARPEPGGLLRYAIPDYRLPRDVLGKEIDYLRRLGVEIRTGVRVGEDVSLAEIRRDHEAVFLGVGAGAGAPLRVEGGDLPGVTDGIRFLGAVKAGERVELGERVAVIGGGNTAVDCARTARRLGAGEVRLVYRRSRAEMRASEEEVAGLEAEGVGVDYLTLPARFLAEDGRVAAMQCTRMALGEPDAGGRRRPVPVPGSEFTVAVDTVIAAVGQVPGGDFLEDLGVSLGPGGAIATDPSTGATGAEGIFAGGDAVTGPSYVIDAIAAGKRAARAIGRYLSGEPPGPGGQEREPERLTPSEVAALRERFPHEPRVAARLAPVAARVRDFREVDLGLAPSQAVEEAKRCLAGKVEGCIACGECERRCGPGAIDHGQHPEALELEVGAVVLAPGYDLFDASALPEFGHGRFPNVVSALEFERILSASGPYAGHVLRPYDRRPPKRIAFLQCVGSRDAERDYCSSICCMYATKEAIIAKEHSGNGLECDVFFMDVRAFGKGFEDYYERARKLGVTYIRCRPTRVEEVPGSRNLVVEYLAEGDRKVSREYDLVVLSVGARPPRGADGLARALGVHLNGFGFCGTAALRPVETSREGVYVAGPFAEPKDIPETVMQASAAASRVLSLLRDERGSLVRRQEYPPEREVAGEEPRVGVFVCHCGTNIAGVVNVPDAVAYARTLPNVVYAENALYACSNDTQERIRGRIAEHGLNRVVVASCTPRTHEPLFRSTLREAGLNPYLFEMANIRDQCSWVHMHEHEKASVKARDLIRMAVAKARLLEPLATRSIPVVTSALVVGGGLAGMTAATALAEQGFGVFLVEREAELGGHLRSLRYLAGGQDVATELDGLVGRVGAAPGLRVFTSARIEAIEGSIGRFRTRLAAGGTIHDLEHGVVIVATGARQYAPTEHLYGDDPRVVTQLELEERLAAGQAPEGSNGRGTLTVVMLQCVGSRDEERPYCSRVCCTQAVKNALRLKELSPAAAVYVLCRDVRTYGFREGFYTRARQQGVVFVRHGADRKPVVSRNGEGLTVQVWDQTLGVPLAIPADLVALSTGLVAHDDSKALAQLLKIPLNKDGFFLEAHLKLRPVDFATDGVFLAGLAHSPKAVDETVVQAQAAATRAATVLCRDALELGGNISFVVDENCDGCAYCVDTCPYKAITLLEYMRDGAIKKTVEANEAVCKGCGCCMATCPKQGIYVKGFKLEQIAAQVHAALGMG